MTTPVVSVIMPTFNRLKYIPAAVDSVFAQTFRDWELIIADDGSDAQTKAYLRTLARTPRVKVIWLDHTGDPGAVRNAAMSEANGEFIAFLDSDDFWSPQKLDVQLSALRKAPGCRWSYTAFTMVDANGEPLATECTRRWDSHSGGVFKRLLGQKLAITTPTVIAARRLIEQAGGFRVGQLLYEDYDLWSRLALLSEAQAIDMPLTCVRKHAEHYGRTVRGPAAWWRAKWRWSVARAVLGLYLPHRLRGRRLSGSKPTDTDETKPA